MQEEEIDYNFREKEAAMGGAAPRPEYAGPAHVGPADVGRLLAKTRAFCQFLDRRSDGEADAIEVRSGSVVVCIGAGEQHAVAGAGPLECRAARDGGLRLVDQRGVSICFLRDFRPQWVNTTKPGVTARLAFPDAQSCQDACQAASDRLKTLALENPAAVSAAAVNELQARLEAVRRICDGRFWLSRAKTVIFDLWQCATRGSALAREVQAADYVLTVEFPDEEPAAQSGKPSPEKLMLQLDERKMAAFAEINSTRAHLLQQWADRAGRLKEQIHRLKLLVRGAEQLLATIPQTEVAQAAAAQLRSALTSVGSQERVWVGLCKKRRVG